MGTCGFTASTSVSLSQAGNHTGGGAGAGFVNFPEQDIQCVLVLDVIKNTYNQNGKKLIKAGTRRLSTFLGKWFVKTELEGVGVWLSAFKVLKELQLGLVVKGSFCQHL